MADNFPVHSGHSALKPLTQRSWLEATVSKLWSPQHIAVCFNSQIFRHKVHANALNLMDANKLFMNPLHELRCVGSVTNTRNWTRPTANCVHNWLLRSIHWKVFRNKWARPYAFVWGDNVWVTLPNGDENFVWTFRKKNLDIQSWNSKIKSGVVVHIVLAEFGKRSLLLKRRRSRLTGLLQEVNLSETIKSKLRTLISNFKRRSTRRNLIVRVSNDLTIKKQWDCWTVWLGFLWNFYNSVNRLEFRKFLRKKRWTFCLCPKRSDN